MWNAARTLFAVTLASTMEVSYRHFKVKKRSGFFLVSLRRDNLHVLVLRGPPEKLEKSVEPRAFLIGIRRLDGTGTFEFMYL